MARLKALAVIAGAALSLVGCGGQATVQTATSLPVVERTPTPAPTSTPTPAPTSTPTPVPTCDSLACVMTKDSGVDGIPLPADAVVAQGSLVSVPTWNTAAGTMGDFVAFYKQY